MFGSRKVKIDEAKVHFQKDLHRCAGYNLLTAMTFHVSEVEAQIAQNNAADDGCATRLQRVRVPTTPRDLVSLLTDYVSGFALR